MFGSFIVVVAHDVATSGLTLSRIFSYSGISSTRVTVGLSVENLGSSSETFTLTVMANSSIINSQTVTLNAGATMPISFGWNTTLLAVGNYTVSAQVSQVPGESNTQNNSATFNGLFESRKAGDADGNGVVDIDDVLLTAIAWGGDYNQYTDYDADGDVDIDDVLNVATRWGT